MTDRTARQELNSRVAVASVLAARGEVPHEAKLKRCRSLAQNILLIRWGWDGDGGANWMAEEIQDELGQILSQR